MSTSGDSQPYLNDFMMRDDEDVSGDDESDNKHSGGNYMLREQDRFLPICNIIKIMKVPVPENGKIAKDARECIQECVSEFISFITSEAIERSIAENRKTVNGDDLLYAFANLGFDNYVDPLSMYLHKFRESTKSDRNLYNEPNMLQDDSSTEFPTIADNSNSTITAKALTTLAGTLTNTNPAVITTNSVAGTANTFSDVKLFEIIETNQQQHRQQNGIHDILPTHAITITPTSTSTSGASVNLLSTGCNQTSDSVSNTNATLASVRRSARLQTRPQLPVITTVANEIPSSIMNAADQLIYFDADELHQHVLQQQQHQLNNSGNHFMQM
ncbi:nuclear transcription factor Y subunit nfyb-1 isoform X2 [Anastrepha ludens]|uniref:nuclear transcription factor Y subunit nfyb-1 isoform X2 n=1 Tax=Anastrepha ludens TaxID=28586 RepID=UPI0023B1CB37|nr:nuclear transcription factor Y subunit nfyb-1 isoform X2 [Anastrepha ludens]